MHAKLVRRALLLSLTVVLALSAGVNAESPSLPGTRNVSFTTSREIVHIRACDGFDAVTSYTVSRDYHLVTDPDGKLVFERRHVVFAGTMENAETGWSFPYDGGFTRTADYEQGTVAITDLRLRLRLGLPAQSPITVTIDRQNHDLTDNPPAVLLAVAPHALSTGLCELLGGGPVADSTSPFDLLRPAPAAEGPAAEPIAQSPDLCDPVTRAGRPC